MILSLALSLALAAQEDPAPVHHGAWTGYCYRSGHLAGMDHELCKVHMWVEESGPGAEIERSAEGIRVRPQAGECSPTLEPGFLPASVMARRNRAAIVTALVRRLIEAQVNACRSALRVPPIREQDISAVLRDSDGLAPGSFVPLDRAVRAPAATRCGQQLARAWRDAIARHPATETGHVGLMMYTMSERGPERAQRRFEARPELMEDVFAMGTGPGGSMIDARKPARSWHDAPDEWFVALCDTGIEAWSSFVELSLYDGPDATSPAFSVRALTGVAGPGGFQIWSG